VHDDIADVFVVLLKNAGFVDVAYEDVWWDAGAAYEDSETGGMTSPVSTRSWG
jgi:hypothetical protein